METNSKCLLCGKSTEPTTTLNLNEAFITAYIMKKLEEPFLGSEAFKLGIIDRNGNQIKVPQTLEEKLSFTAIDSYLIKIKKMLGNRSEMLNHAVYLEHVTNVSNLPIELYEKELEFKSELGIISKRFKECLSEAKENNLPTELIEKIILESFM
jgi:hypothetical protein